MIEAWVVPRAKARNDGLQRRPRCLGTACAITALIWPRVAQRTLLGRPASRRPAIRVEMARRLPSTRASAPSCCRRAGYSRRGGRLRGAAGRVRGAAGRVRGAAGRLRGAAGRLRGATVVCAARRVVCAAQIDAVQLRGDASDAESGLAARSARCSLSISLIEVNERPLQEELIRADFAHDVCRSR
jgi:hypothetical protein